MTPFGRLLDRLFLADCTHSVFRPKAAVQAVFGMSAAPCRTFVGQRFFDLAKATGQGADLDAVRESTTRRNGQRRKASKPVN